MVSKWYYEKKDCDHLIIGLLIGFATMMRPTELLLIIVPLIMKNSQGQRFLSFSPRSVGENHVLFGLGMFLGSIIQIIYWLYVTGNPIHTIGSKWRFLDPWWRVLIGWEKGWIIYTPVVVFFLLGLFFLKGKPLKKSIVWFVILNIWIVISWNNWRYGGSYSTRALVQSYPFFFFGLCGFIAWVKNTKWNIPFTVLSVYLVVVNLFQIWQYNKTIIHYDHMNFDYYRAVYLDPSPSALDMSLLDGDRYSIKENAQSLYSTDSIQKVDENFQLKLNVEESHYIHIKLKLKSIAHYWDGKINVKQTVMNSNVIEQQEFRTFHAMTLPNDANTYEMIIEVNDDAKFMTLDFSPQGYIGEMKFVEVKAW